MPAPQFWIISIGNWLRAHGRSALARRLAPEADFCEGNAVALPFADASFDLIVSQAGFQFFPDRLQAAREMRRVLMPGGRLALSVWRAVDEHPLLVGFAEAAARHLGPLAPDRRHAFGDAEALRAVLAEGGFKDIEVCSRKSGQPYLVLHGGAGEIAGRLGIDEILITISHCRAYATATAVAMQRTPRPS